MKVESLVDIRDTRLFVEERGSGQPVVALHGGPGADDTQLLNPLIPLSDEFRLLFVDQRSQDRSDSAPKETWSFSNAAQDVSDIAHALGLERYAVLGHSYGALVALTHAIEHPGAAAATVISHGVSSVRWYRLGEELEELEPPEIREQGRDAWARLESAETAAEMTELIGLQAPFHFANPTGPAVAEEAQRYREQMIHTPEVNRYMSETQLPHFDLEDELSSIAQPVLILSGRHERTCPLEAAAFMAERIPDAEFHVFENSAHVSYVEERDAYLAVVREFFRRHLG